jgi:hypothetical protein
MVPIPNGAVASPERFHTTALAPGWIKPQVSLFNSVFFARLQLVVIAATAQRPVELADLNRVPDPDGIDSF